MNTPNTKGGLTHANDELSELFKDEKSGIIYELEVSVEEGKTSSNKNGSDKSGSLKNQVQVKHHPEPLPEEEAKVTPSRNFEGDVIEVKHTMSDFGDLTMGSFDAASVLSKSIKVAMNENHPQHNEALSFIKRMTCSHRYDCIDIPEMKEFMDDAVEGWKDIYANDNLLCDGEHSFTDDSSCKSDCSSLNTVDEFTLDKSGSFFENKRSNCRDKKGGSDYLCVSEARYSNFNGEIQATMSNYSGEIVANFDASRNKLANDAQVSAHVATIEEIASQFEVLSNSSLTACEV